MGKKVGILTRHCYPNYGSLLQTYALQSALRVLGATPIVLDYISDDDTAFGLVKANLRISRKARYFIGFLMYVLIQTPIFLSMFSVFRRHQKRLLCLSARAKDYDGLSKVAADLDLVVAGSDQIWNRIIDSIDENYFLPFVKERSQRFSYAASLGSVTPHLEDVDLLLDSIKTLHTVSIREPTSAKWISDQGISARTDIDPVLLHGRDFWEKFANKEKKEFQYILVYQLHNSDNFRKRLSEIQSKTGLPVVRISPDWKHIFRSGKTKVLISPESFLSWIRDATCVVTDSFHGTAFSLKFGRPIYVVPPGKYSARLTDMMTRVGLEKLVVSSDNNQPLPNTPEYDSEHVEKLLKDQAAASWGYLSDLLRDGQYGSY